MVGSVIFVSYGLLLLILVHQALCVTYTSSGVSSNTSCTSDGLQCLTSDRAQCVNGECVCSEPQFPNGDGRISCHWNSEIFAGVFNDPMVTTLNGNHANLPIFCRYTFTSFQTKLFGRGGAEIGKCQAVIKVWHEKDLGKSVVGGMDIAVHIKYKRDARPDPSTPRVKFSMRIMGRAENGVYTYEVLGTNGFYSPDGPFNDDVIAYADNVNNVKYKITYDSTNNIIFFGISKCGLRIKFRAYDYVKRRYQTQMPGAVIGINQNNEPRYRERESVIGMVPISNSKGFTVDRIKLTGLGRSETLSHRAFVSGIVQSQPEPNNECAKAKDVMAACNTDTKLLNAFTNCYWMLKSPRFIKLFDPSVAGTGIMGLFNNCTAVYCSGFPCSQVVSAITNSPAADVTGYADLDNFKSGSMCP